MRIYKCEDPPTEPEHGEGHSIHGVALLSHPGDYEGGDFYVPHVSVFLLYQCLDMIVSESSSNTSVAWESLGAHVFWHHAFSFLNEYIGCLDASIKDRMKQVGLMELLLASCSSNSAFICDMKCLFTSTCALIA